MSNIVLIGMPGCGKSTVGVVLAKAMGKTFMDTDLLIQERESELLQSIIDREGMEYFLEKEEEALCSIEAENTVIATGGSAVYSKKAMDHLKLSGKVIYLKLSLETIKGRLCDIRTRGIAIAPGESLNSLFEKRTPLYEQYADLILNVEGKSLEETVEYLLNGIAFTG